MAFEDIDLVDIGLGLGGIALTAVAATPLIAVPLSLLWLGQYAIRRSSTARQWTETIQQPEAQRYVQKLLAAPKDQDVVVLQQDKPLDVKLVGDRWVDRIRQPLEYDSSDIAVIAIAKKQQQKPLTQALKMLPRELSYTVVPDPPTPTSVPIGYSSAKIWVWSDFSRDTLHAMIAGQTGCGKDSLLRLWFTMLTANNTPEQVQFIIFDGKGEWLTPALQQSKHMFIPPIGGVEVIKEGGRWVDKANDRIEEGIGLVFEEINKRNVAFQKVGASNIYTYAQKTGIKYPLLFIIFTDVQPNVEKDLGTLVKMLTIKGRSFGIRLIISTQTVSGQDTGWRGQLALAMSGYQQLSSADKPNLGIDVAYMRYRPSDLPSPDNPANRGLFIARKGNDQYLVRVPYLPDDIFEEYCENTLTRGNIKDVSQDNDFLMQLLQQPKKPVAKRPVLTRQEVDYIVWQRMNGMNKTDIMHSLGITNGNVYKEVSPIVDTLIRAVDIKMRGMKT